MRYSWENFYICTVADWSRCELPERTPDFVSFSGSAYWRYKNKVRRASDHWGEVSSCKWLLEGKTHNRFLCAECDFDEFRHISACQKGKFSMKYLQGDLFQSFQDKDKKFIIPHVVNSVGAWGSGFVVPLGKMFPEARDEYMKWSQGKVAEVPFKLGSTYFVEVTPNIIVAHMLAQELGGVRPLFYNALSRCVDAVGELAQDQEASIHAPLFGAGLAGGSWEFIHELLKDSWTRQRDIPVTLFYLENAKPAGFEEFLKGLKAD